MRAVRLKKKMARQASAALLQGVLSEGNEKQQVQELFIFLHKLMPTVKTCSNIVLGPFFRRPLHMQVSSSADQDHHALLQFDASFLVITLCTGRQAAMLCLIGHAISGLCAMFGLLHLACHVSANDLVVSHENSCSFDCSTELQHYHALQW